MMSVTLFVLMLCIWHAQGREITHIEGRCEFVSREMLGACGDAIVPGFYYFPGQLRLSDDSTLNIGPEMIRDRLPGFMEEVTKTAALVGPTCGGKQLKALCPGFYRPCTTIEVGEVTYVGPRRICKTWCQEIWDVCGPAMIMGIEDFGMTAREIPLCGLYKDIWTTFIPVPLDESILDSLSMGYLAPEPFEGTRVFAEGSTTYELDGQEWECFAPNEIDVQFQCVPCEPPLVRAAVNTSDCQCYTPCPVLKDDVVILKYIVVMEKIFAAISFPLLLYLLYHEVRDMIKAKSIFAANYFVLTATIMGLLYDLIIIILVHDDQSGCNEDKVFHAEKIQFWTETDAQRMTCFVTMSSPFLLQSLLFSLACFLWEVKSQFEQALSFHAGVAGGFRKWLKRLLYGFLMIGLPTTGYAVSLKHVLSSEFEKRGITSPGVLWNTLRYHHKCGPYFPTQNYEVAFVLVPVGAAIILIVLISVTLLCQTRRVMDGSGKINQTRAVIRLSKQMAALGSAFAVLLCIKLAAESFLVENMRSYSVLLSRTFLCEVAGDLFNHECDPTETADNILGAETMEVAQQHFMLVASNLTWMVIPTLYSLVLLVSIFMKSKVSISSQTFKMKLLGKLKASVTPSGIHGHHRSSQGGASTVATTTSLVSPSHK